MSTYYTQGIVLGARDEAIRQGPRPKKPAVKCKMHMGEAPKSLQTGTAAMKLKDACSLEEKAMAPHSSTLAWKLPWTEEPGGLQSMGSLRVRHD